MIDIHSHILPGVDDGSKSLEDSMEIAKIYLSQGINSVIATPHYIEGEGYNTYQENLKVLENLNKKIKENSINFEIMLGNEVYITPNIIDLLDKGHISTLNSSRYLLIEFPMFDIPLYTEEIIYELKLRGITPIIAHPERNRKIVEDPNILFEFITKGALAQTNTESLLGMYGQAIKDTAEILLTHDMIHFIATDAHSKRRRAPRLKKCIGQIISLVGQERFKELTEINPQAVVNNEDIDVYNPVKYRKKWSFKSLFGVK